MNVTDVYNYFEEYVNEDDRTHLTPTQIQRYLRNGYDEFRRVVADYDPNIYARSAVITVTNSRTYDLSTGAVKILGSTPNQPPMLRLLKVAAVDPSDTVRIRYVFYGVKSEEELSQSVESFNTPVYMLQGNTLYFSRLLSDTIKLIYVPYGSKPRNSSGVDWTKTAPSDTEFIDDLATEFGDMIALYAYAQFAARETAENESVLRLLARRLESLQKYLFSGRDQNSAGRLSHVY